MSAMEYQFGTYQLVSETCPDPQIRFSVSAVMDSYPYNYQLNQPLPPASYYNHPPPPHLQSYVPPHLRSDSSFNFRSESKPDFTSNGFIACSIHSTENVRSNNYGISTADLNYIKSELYKVMGMVDRLHDRLVAMSCSLQNCADAVSRSSQPTNLNVHSNIVDLKSSFVMNMSSSIMAPTQDVSPISAPEKVAAPAKLAAPSKVAEMKSSSNKEYVPMQVNLFSHFQSMRNGRVLLHIQHFEFGKIYPVVMVFGAVFESQEYKVFDIMLERNENKISKKCVFVFDPGGAPSVRESVVRGLRVKVIHTKDCCRHYKITRITTELLDWLTFFADAKGAKMRVVDYFQEKYNCKLNNVAWPCLISRSHNKFSQVIFPALEKHVKNIVRAYSLEHKGLRTLFSQLFELLNSSANNEPGFGRELASCIEAIRTLVNQHMSKEEKQVFPWLIQKFSFEEHAELLWNFYCSIPVNTMTEYFPWLSTGINAGNLERISNENLQSEMCTSKRFETDVDKTDNVWTCQLSRSGKRKHTFLRSNMFNQKCISVRMCTFRLVVTAWILEMLVHSDLM